MREPEAARYLPFLQRMLTPARLQHSIAVMLVMNELAGIYSLDRTQALTVGLLHDTAKDLEPGEQLALLEEAGIELRLASVTPSICTPLPAPA